MLFINRINFYCFLLSPLRHGVTSACVGVECSRDGLET